MGPNPTHPISFRKGTRARKKRGQIAEAIKQGGSPVRSPFAVATRQVQKMAAAGQRFDPWEDPRFSWEFPAIVRVLYLTRKDIERQHELGKISDSDYNKYWKGVDAQHLEEVAIEIPSQTWPEMREWVETWGHKGGSWYIAEKQGYAVRCGGANQARDPLNVFFLEGRPKSYWEMRLRMRGLPRG